MVSSQFFNRYRLLNETNALLRRAATVADVFEMLRAQARAIAEADGVAVVERLGDEVTYVGEDAIAPLWTGQRFPIGYCVTGLAMLARERIVIADIRDDPRVPLNLYLSTFVRSMAIYPLGSPRPIAALGLYWREPRVLGRDVDALMTMLAAGANAAFETIAIADEQRRGRAA
jgi:GAF domain-containing protein